MQKRINAKGIVLWKALSTYTTTMYVPLSLSLPLSLFKYGEGMAGICSRSFSLS